MSVYRAECCDLAFADQLIGYYTASIEENQHGVYERSVYRMKKQLYIITGANGHLGSPLFVCWRNRTVRSGMILPGETASSYDNVTYIEGDVRNKESLLPLFDNTEGMNIIFIHTAGIVDISGKRDAAAL